MLFICKLLKIKNKHLERLEGLRHAHSYRTDTLNMSQTGQIYGKKCLKLRICSIVCTNNRYRETVKLRVK